MLCWSDLLKEEKNQSYFKELLARVEARRQVAKVYPERSDVFAAWKLTSLQNLHTVILGQDPYHGPKQAMGLAFSVPAFLPIPPSLVNIYKALKMQGLLQKIPGHGDLTNWAKQGVFLLNTILTVEHHAPLSHAQWGWKRFTDRVLMLLNAQNKPLVFFLWGQSAIQKKSLISNPQHLVLSNVHPSPLSAHRGFFSAPHFQQADHFLKNQGICMQWDPCSVDSVAK